MEKWKNFPIVCVLGPRQSGKTTLAKAEMPELPYFDLEKPSHLASFQSDPESRLNNLGKGIVLDEAQQLPALFPILRGLVDENRNEKGQYLLLGSSSPSLIKNISESLAGRVSFLELSPLSYREVLAGKNSPEDLRNQLWLYGGFPEPWSFGNDILKWDWKESYVQTFIERDLNVLGIQKVPRYI